MKLIKEETVCELVFTFMTHQDHFLPILEQFL